MSKPSKAKLARIAARRKLEKETGLKLAQGANGITPKILTDINPELTLGRIAHATGMSAEHLSRAFRGLRGLSISSASRIASYMGVSMDRLSAMLIAAKEEREEAEKAKTELALKKSEVARLLAKGAGNTEIAERMGIEEEQARALAELVIGEMEARA